MDFSFIAYVFLCIVLGLGIFMQLSNSGRTWGGIVTLILFILIFVFYGIRWFRGTSSVFNYSGSWPPIINMCPDYLVYFKKNNRESCVDLTGVAKSQTVLAPWSSEDTTANPPNPNGNKYFRYVYRPGADAARMKELCTQTINAGLTWEGITNGESCTFTTPPRVEV